MNRVLVLLLMLLVVLSPVPLGSNREWSWTLCSLLAAGLTLLWVLARGWRVGEMERFVHPAIPLLFRGCRLPGNTRSGRKPAACWGKTCPAGSR
jgi:hypothetical protein